MPFVQPTPHIDSPNIGNYYIGRGIMYAQLIGDSGFVDMGNATAVTITVKPTILPHFSSRVGTRFKDFTAVTEIDATGQCTLEEWTPRNLALYLLGTTGADSPTGEVIDMYATPQIFASFKFVGTNTIGPQWTFTMPLVQLSPQKAIDLIAAGSGNWGSIDLQFDILKDPTSGQFLIASATDFVQS